jgi:hypothetical protein
MALVTFTRMRLVVNGANETVRFTRLLPVTVPRTVQPPAVPTFDGEVDDAVAREGHRVGGLRRREGIVLQRVDDHAIERVRGRHVDLQPIRERR